MEFKMYDVVKKKKGYPFKGVIVSLFLTTEGKPRLVVEHCTEIGMLHIYSPEQLELD